AAEPLDKAVRADLHERDVLAFQAAHDVVVRLAGAGPAVEDDRLPLVGGHDHFLIVRHHPDQLDGQDLDDVVDVHHVAPLHHVGADAVDDELGRTDLVRFQHADDPVRVPDGGDLGGRHDEGVVGAGDRVAETVLDAGGRVHQNVVKL